jgi:hypothetical protein
MTNQCMNNPCNHKWYATTKVHTCHMELFFDQLPFATCPKWLEGLYLHVSITITILSSAIKIVVVYFQISSSVNWKVYFKLFFNIFAKVQNGIWKSQNRLATWKIKGISSWKTWKWNEFQA